MRGTPHHTSVADEQRLRRLVPDTEALGDRVGQGAVSLNRDHGVSGIARAITLEMPYQLVQRFRADAAREAVLEEQHGPSVGE